MGRIPSTQTNYVFSRELTAACLRAKLDRPLCVWYALDAWNRANGGRNSLGKAEAVSYLQEVTSLSARRVEGILATHNGDFWKIAKTRKGMTIFTRSLRQVVVKCDIPHLPTADLSKRDVSELKQSYGEIRRTWFAAIAYRSDTVPEVVKARSLDTGLEFETIPEHKQMIAPTSRIAQGERVGRSVPTVKRWDKGVRNAGNLTRQLNYAIVQPCDSYEHAKAILIAMGRQDSNIRAGLFSVRKMPAEYNPATRKFTYTWCIVRQGPNTYIDTSAPASDSIRQYLRNVRKRSKPPKVEDSYARSSGERFSQYAVRPRDEDKPSVIYKPVQLRTGNTIRRRQGYSPIGIWQAIETEDKLNTAWALEVTSVPKPRALRAEQGNHAHFGDISLFSKGNP